MSEEFRIQLDGYGQRLGRQELMTSAHDVKIIRNENDIKTIFEGIDKMQKTINAMIWKIFLMVSIPSVLLAIQLVSKATGGK